MKLPRLRLPRLGLDRWDVLFFAAFGLLGAGVWDLAGRGWALVTWGSLLLAIVALRAWRGKVV